MRQRTVVSLYKEGDWLNIGVNGRAIWPTVETKVRFGNHELILRPATRETEQSIHILLDSTTDTEALTLINRFLSVLSWVDDQSMENLYGWSGSRAPVSVSKEARQCGSSIAFPFYREIEKTEKGNLALALYREGTTINSVPFAFLSYFKILNIFWCDKFQKGKNPLIEGLRTVLPKIADQEAVDRIMKLKKQIPDVAKYLYKSGRCAVAHAHISPIVDPDDVKDLRRLSEDMSVIKAVARFLMVDQLKISTTIY